MDFEIVLCPAPPRDLLLLADEYEASVDDYIHRCTCYAARRGTETLGACCVIHTRPFTAEIVNLAVAPAHQRQGIGTALLRYAVIQARSAGFRTLEIGTGDSSTGPLALYERCGFRRTGIDRDYFRRHYPAPIFENGIECRHMVRLAMELK